MFKTKSEILEVLIKALPLPFIYEIDLESESNSIKFSWNGKRFRITTDNFIEEYEKHLLISGTNEVILIGALMRKQKEINSLKSK